MPPVDGHLPTRVAQRRDEPFDQFIARWEAARPALLRVCAGEATALTPLDLNVIGLIAESAHTGYYLARPLEEKSLEPGSVVGAQRTQDTLGEVIVRYLVEYYGLDRGAGGRRVEGVASAANRYLLPIASDLSRRVDGTTRYTSHILREHLRVYVQILAGDQKLPAATVAGKHLGRNGVSSIWLTLEDATRVVANPLAPQVPLTAQQLLDAVPTVADVRTGQPVVAAADLRDAGLLIELEAAHGLSKLSARNVLGPLHLAFQDAAANGVLLGAGTFKLRAIKPQDTGAQNADPVERNPVTFADVVRLCAELPPVGQLAMWLMRLTSMRIGEAYGLTVEDFGRDEENRPFLMVERQGGSRTLERVPGTGQFEKRERKDRTKSRAGRRRIHIVEPLARLVEHAIAVFHTDANGIVRVEDRLIPGLRADDQAGKDSLSRWLREASVKLNLQVTSHDNRRTFITDLMDHDVDRRLRFGYCGHEDQKGDIQDQHYDLGIKFEDQRQLVELVDELLFEALVDVLPSEDGILDLRIATPKRDNFGPGTRHAQDRHLLTERLRNTPWSPSYTVDRDQPTDPELDTVEVAAVLGCHPSQARELMRTQVISARQRAWGKRKVWVSLKSAVELYAANQSRPTLNLLAEELGVPYKRAWDMLQEVEPGADSGRLKGESIRLAPETADAIREAHGRLQQDLDGLLTVRMAATSLGIPVGVVETLARRGVLELQETSRRERYLTAESVHAYRAQFPVNDADPDSGCDLCVILVAERHTRELLGLSRTDLTFLTNSRQLEVRERGRRLRFTAASIADWVRREIPARAPRVLAALEDLGFDPDAMEERGDGTCPHRS